MDLNKLQQRAIQVRAMYSQLEQNNYGQSWNTTDLALGFVGDVGDLMKLIMAREGKRVIEDCDQKLAHELSDCFWSILVLANIMNIDLEKSFIETMDLVE